MKTIPIYSFLPPDSPNAALASNYGTFARSLFRAWLGDHGRASIDEVVEHLLALPLPPWADWWTLEVVAAAARRGAEHGLADESGSFKPRP